MYPHTQFFGYPNYAGDTRFYKIGRLYLPLNGHQAVITVNLCYGFNVNNNGLLNYAGYNIQNYEMKIHLYSSTSGTSRACFPDSFGPNLALRNDNNYSLFHNGYVVVSSPFVSALGVSLARFSRQHESSWYLGTFIYVSWVSSNTSFSGCRLLYKGHDNGSCCHAIIRICKAGHVFQHPYTII